MANTNAPFGFRQYSGTGSAPTYEQNVRYIASDNTTAIYFGDAVIPLTTGYIGQATASTVRVEGIFAGPVHLTPMAMWKPISLMTRMPSSWFSQAIAVAQRLSLLQKLVNTSILQSALATRLQASLA